MKKWIAAYTIILCIIPLAQLTGCSQEFMSDQLDIERFLPVQTMGFDNNGDTLTVSLSTGGEQDTPFALVMKSPAPNIESALTRLQDYSPVDELYYEHIQYIILGEGLAESGIEPMLDWVERSPFMRMDTSVFLVKGSAEEAIYGASGEMGGITERLSSIDRESDARSQHVYTLLEIAAALSDRGSALCSAVECVPSDGTVTAQKGSLGNAVLPAGYGVLREGKLISFLDAKESLGASLFRQDPTGTVITVDNIALEILEGRTKTRGIFSQQGKLTGLSVTADMKAGILETKGNTPDIPALEKAFAEAVQDAVAAVLARSQALSCDFLGLEDSIFLKTPNRARSPSESWEEYFAGLPVTVYVQGEIQRGYDRKG